MANRRRAPEPPPLEVRRFSTAQAERWSKLLETRIGEVKALDATNVRYDDERVRALERKIRSNVLEIFGENSREYRDHQYHEISGEGR